ncbi:hypothetical protein [Streptomyces sp. NBC_00280]|uniref:hypothetical protein n=1 Tax=Streptomyces sp. NBC_00280 TaxID=2975699 RepID=UPI003244D202
MSTDIDEVETWLEGRELLGRAVGGVSAPTGAGTEAVFARAARVRRRRWGAVTVVAAAVVAVGVVVGPGWLMYDRGGGRGADTTTPRPPGKATAKAARLAKLLPAGVGEIREVNMDAVLRPGSTIGAVRTEYKEYAYFGSFTVSRDGGVGFIRVINGYGSAEGVRWKNPCSIPGNDPQEGCTFERLSNGDVLEYQTGMDDLGSLTMDNRRTWGEYLTVRLYQRNGDVVEVQDSTGFTGPTSLGPLLKTLPLTKSQLRELALVPEVMGSRQG